MEMRAPNDNLGSISNREVASFGSQWELPCQAGANTCIVEVVNRLQASATTVRDVTHISRRRQIMEDTIMVPGTLH
jgi:23S rRNA A1618 N6-methylase RlmF